LDFAPVDEAEAIFNKWFQTLKNTEAFFREKRDEIVEQRIILKEMIRNYVSETSFEVHANFTSLRAARRYDIQNMQV